MLAGLFGPAARRRLGLSALMVVLLLAEAACSGTPSNFGRYFRGRTLDLSVVALERLPELRYSTMGPQQEFRHFRLIPSKPEFELVLVRLKVENHTATSAILNVDQQGAELRDFFQGKYFPLDISLREQGGRMEQVADPPGRKGWSVKLIQATPDGQTVPGQGFIHGAFELRKDTGVDGWMVFEVPKGTRFRELWWRAGDALTVEF